jgi:hypothetical protein
VARRRVSRVHGFLRRSEVGPLSERRAISVDELELAARRPYEPPAGGPARLGKPDEDAWNRYAGDFAKVHIKRRRDEAPARREAIRAFYGARGWDGVELEKVADELVARGEDERLSEVAALKTAIGDHTLRGGDALILTARKSAESCQPRSVLTKCGCGARLVDGGCERTSCVRCAPSITADRARRVVTKLEANLDAQRVQVKHQTGKLLPRGLFSFRVSVFTMPVEKREAFATKATHNRARRNLMAVLRRNFNAAWTMCATHPVGDEDPSVFHPHFNVLWGKRGLAPGVLPPAELARLKRWWAWLLEHDGNLPRQPRKHPKTAPLVMPEGPPRWSVDVYGEFVKGDDEKRIRHRARYYARVFVGWGFWMPKAVQWFGEYVRGLVPLVLCPCCKERFSIMAMGNQAVALAAQLLESARQRGQAPPGFGAGELFEGRPGAGSGASLQGEACASV